MAPSLHSRLCDAVAIGKATPFDPAAAFLFMAAMVRDVGLQVGPLLEAAMRTALAEADSAEPYRSAVARYALCSVVAELQALLARDAAAERDGTL